MGFRVYAANADLDADTSGLHPGAEWLEQIAALDATLGITVA